MPKLMYRAFLPGAGGRPEPNPDWRWDPCLMPPLRPPPGEKWPGVLVCTERAHWNPREHPNTWVIYATNLVPMLSEWSRLTKPKVIWEKKKGKVIPAVPTPSIPPLVFGPEPDIIEWTIVTVWETKISGTLDLVYLAEMWVGVTLPSPRFQEAVPVAIPFKRAYLARYTSRLRTFWGYVVLTGKLKCSSDDTQSEISKKKEQLLKKMARRARTVPPRCLSYKPEGKDVWDNVDWRKTCFVPPVIK